MIVQLITCNAGSVYTDWFTGSRLPGSRRSVFEDIEREALRALPAQPYEYLDIKNAQVHIAYYIEYKRHYYSVPHSLVKTQVEVRASAKMVSVYAGGKRVAHHPRSRHKGRHTTLTEHMPSGHRFMADWSIEHFERWAADIGQATLIVVKAQFAQKRHAEQSFRAVLALLSLAKQYDRVRLEAACQRALEINSTTRTSVESTLKKGLDALPLTTASDTDVQDEMFLQEHENVRGPEHYHWSYLLWKDLPGLRTGDPGLSLRVLSALLPYLALARTACDRARRRTLRKIIAQLARTDLLVLDDWGLEKMTLGQRIDVLELMED